MEVHTSAQANDPRNLFKETFHIPEMLYNIKTTNKIYGPAPKRQVGHLRPYE